MSRRYKMTWEKGKQRWRKMHGGKIYTISPERLGCPSSKDESYREANAWWETKLIEIRGQAPPDQYDLLIKKLQASRAWLEGQGIESHFDPTSGLVVASDTELANRLAQHTTPTNRSVGYWIAKFLAMRKDEVTGNELSISQYELIRLCLDKFKEWIDEATNIDQITPDRWVALYQHLLTLNISVEYKKKRLTNTRNFISWLVEQGLIPAFASLFAKRYKFTNSRDEVRTVEKDVIKAIIDKATGRIKLVLLLMANTGMNQIDISNLKLTEYKDGRITRSRSKTKKQGTRVVSWKLWGATQKLLDEYQETSGDRLFLTESGRPWLRDEMVDGKRAKTDAVSSVYRHMKTGITLKQIRQTSGDMINHKFGRPVADHFLGHGMKPVDASYFSRSQESLDDAIQWLGEQYGVK
jgi:site-specific recombinase XerD